MKQQWLFLAIAQVQIILTIWYITSYRLCSIFPLPTLTDAETSTNNIQTFLNHQSTESLWDCKGVKLCYPFQITTTNHVTCKL